MKNFRFLFFLYYFPPTPGTAAKRNFRIAAYISRLASSTHIFTSSSGLQNLPPGKDVTIETLPTFDYRYFLRQRTKDGALPEEKKKSRLAQYLIRLINSYPINIIAGEGGLLYYIKAIRKGSKLIQREKITHLYSSYRPFADHYAAYHLKRKYPELIWIADFRDLMIDPHYNHILLPGSHHAFYKKIFSNADLLTTVSDGLATQLRRYNSRVITVRNGIQGEIIPISPVAVSYFTLAYTGSMFLDKRNAEPLTKALGELLTEGKLDNRNVRIVYAGKDGKYWKLLTKKYAIESLLLDKGIIDAEETAVIQKNACINVLLTISSDQLQGVLTGKMIEYFESGSPMLAIIAHQNDHELQQILQELEIGDSFSDQPTDFVGIKQFILREYLKWKETGMNRKPVNMDVLRMKYSQEYTMKPLVEFLIKMPDERLQTPDA